MDMIAVEQRNTKLNGKQLRKQGIVPCCVYGGHLPASIAIQMEEKTAEKLLRTLRLGSKVQLQLGDQVITTQIKDKNRCFEDNKIEHIGFQALAPEVKVNSVAHILLKNEEAVPGVLEVSIGHALVADALELGYDATVKGYLGCINEAFAPATTV